MTNLLISTSQVPRLPWTIVAQDFTQLQVASPAYLKLPSAFKSPRASEATVAPSTSLEAKLFDNAANLKIAYSRIAMHLTPEWRSAIFCQIDLLLDFDDWQEDSAFIQESAFSTFLRFIIFSTPSRFPSLGVSQVGNLLAAWSDGAKRIALEFFPNDNVAGTFVKQGPPGKETVTWRGPVASLRHFIEQIGVADCVYGN